MCPKSEMLHNFNSLTPSKHGETKVLPANASSGTDQADEVWYRMCSESLGEEELNAKVVEFLHIQFSQLGLRIFFFFFCEWSNTGEMFGFGVVFTGFAVG